MSVSRFNQFLVVRSYNIYHILCAAVGYHHIIPIENVYETCSKVESADLTVEELLRNIFNR